MTRARVSLRGLALPLCLVSCSGAQASPDPPPATDAGDETPLDFGAPSDVYPAFRPPVPQVVSAGGPVMTAVHVKPVFYQGDPLEPKLVDFLQKLAASSSWAKIVGEYGVGALDVLSPAELQADPPPKITDDEIKKWLAAQLDGTVLSSLTWGINDATTLPGTLYILFYPAATTVQAGGGKGCVDFAGYHNDVPVKDGTAIYAVIPRCGTSMDPLAFATSHEAIEAATDPLWGRQPAYSDVDPLDSVWAYYLYGGEVGDLCQLLPTSSYTDPAIGNTIQRGWSNRSASAYHDPCVPIPDGTSAYFNSAPVLPDLVRTRDGRTVRGVEVKLGQSRTIEVDLFSDGPTGGAWKVHAYDVALFKGQKSTLKLSLDRDSGQNGEKVHLTITPTAMPGNGAGVFLLDSHLGGRDEVWVGAVGVKE